MLLKVWKRLLILNPGMLFKNNLAFEQWTFKPTLLVLNSHYLQTKWNYLSYFIHYLPTDSWQLHTTWRYYLNNTPHRIQILACVYVILRIWPLREKEGIYIHASKSLIPGANRVYLTDNRQETRATDTQQKRGGCEMATVSEYSISVLISWCMGLEWVSERERER